LALKMVLPQWRVRLYEPNSRRAAFLREVSSTLRIKDVEISRERWREAEIDPKSVDAITARAVGHYDELAGWAGGVCKPNGKLLLWLGGVESRKVLSIPAWRWRSTSLPGSDNAVLLIGSPQS
ncbi:MAG TPA: RsmG family class I SAM-dependent methyltransferase, partial [Burkholderiales bacterium]